MIRAGKANDGGYVLPEISMEKADVLIGYGIADDISFEEYFADHYKKPAYGFDCGIEDIKINNNLVKFIPECIVTDKFLYGNQTSSHQTSIFAQQIETLKLQKKQILIKMDIEGAEYQAMHSILEHYKYITGIVLELHIYKNEDATKALHLLKTLSKKFVLVHVHVHVHVHGNNFRPGWFYSNNSKGKLPNVLELSYVNKNLIHDYEISSNQNHPRYLDMPNNPKRRDINFEIIP